LLFLVATPIGNLLDITLRALEVLKSVDLILCEDTRHSAPFLRHYDIEAALMSYEQFSEKSKLEKILEMLQSGKNIALISDAGTPAVCDPGALLVKNCIEKNLSVQSLPGAAAPIVAYSLLGTMKPFQFIGFFPKKGGEQSELFKQIQFYPGITIFFESPHRILKTIESIPFDCKITLFRELTKKFEERIEGTKHQILEILNKKEHLGELVVAIEPSAIPSQDSEALFFAKDLISNHGLSLSSAAKIAAEHFKVKKQPLYEKLNQELKNS
jgi:16S rRNA (cytidine1402-2'-O)-methyltransferase